MSFKVSLPHIGPFFCAVSATKYRFWCRVKGEGVGVIRYKQSEHNRIQVHSFPLMPRYDNTGVIDLELKPNESYMVQMGYVKGASLEQLSLPDLDLNWPKENEMHFTTFPGATADDLAETAFLMGSCRHLGGWFSGSSDASFECIDNMLQANSIKPAFILMTGDQIYADANGKRISGPPDNLEAYLKKYRNAYTRSHFARVLRKLASYSIFNDHDIQKNWSIGKFENGEKGFEMENFSDAILAYQSYQANKTPVIKDAMLISEEAEYGLSVYGEKGYGEIPFWYRFSHGQCDFFVMDVRGERREPSSMISAQQMEQVQQFLLDKPQQKKFIVSSIPIFPDTKPPFGVPADKWTAFPNQRKQLLQFIHDKQKTGDVKDVTFLAGGVHCSFVAKAAFPDVQYTMYSVVSSAFNWFIKGLSNSDFIWDEVRGFPRNELSMERKPYGGGVTKVQENSNFAYLSVVGDAMKITYYSSEGDKLEEHDINFNTQPVQQTEKYAVVGRLNGLGSITTAAEPESDAKVLAFGKNVKDSGQGFY